MNASENLIEDLIHSFRLLLRVDRLVVVEGDVSLESGSAVGYMVDWFGEFFVCSSRMEYIKILILIEMSPMNTVTLL